MIINYRKKRFKVRFMRFFNLVSSEKQTLTELQKKSIAIFRKMVLNQKSTLLTDPLNGGCYVEYDHYFIKLTNRNLLIKNTTFSNYIEFDYTVGDKLVMFFYKHVSDRRAKMESVYDGNTLKNLDDILKKIK